MVGAQARAFGEQRPGPRRAPRCVAERERLVDPRDHRTGGVGRGIDRGLTARQAAFQLGGEHGEDELVLAGEVSVERARGETGALEDVGDGEAGRPVFGERRERRLEERGHLGFGAGARGFRRPGCDAL